MKKILQMVFFIALFFIFAKSSFAFEPFVKSSRNPLPFTSSYPNWNEIAAVQPFVLQENNTLKMWYITYNGIHATIAYAVSSDGVNWRRNSLLDINPLFDHHNPSILKTNTGYLLYFASSQNGSSYKISKITLSDETHFDPSSQKIILNQSPEPGWDSTGISDPFVVYKNSKYYLFYAGRGLVDNWHLGLATSNDGENWTRCVNNPILTSAAGPHFIEDQGVSYLFFHSSTGIEQVETTDDLSCNTVWKNRHNVIGKGPQYYDVNHMISPSAIRFANSMNLYYSGLGSDGKWRISLASSPPFILQEKNPIVIIPGLMASWNKDAMLHNQSVSYFDWHILPFVHEYEGLVQSLKNLGYVENQDFFIFSYDWRKGLEETATHLDNFLQQKVVAANPGKKIDIVGHSLGGLVGRIWEQKFPHEMLNSLITVGTPHLGVAQAYKPVEAGEIDHDNSLLWLAEKLIIMINKQGFENDRVTISSVFPILKDLLPTFPYLQKEDGQFIDPVNQQIKNDTLNSYNHNLSDVISSLKAIAGQKGDTLSGFRITTPSSLDILFNRYPDGKPTFNLTQQGDFVVPVTSATVGNNTQMLPFNHGEIIYKKEGIEEILKQLHISFQDHEITEGNGTQITPALIFLIKSPATIKVTGPQNESYIEQDGMIFIPNSKDGDYKLEVIGKELGTYSVIVGETTTTVDYWNQIDGIISQSPPSSQTDSYQVSFNSTNPQEYFIDQNNISSLFNLLIMELTLIDNQTNNNHLQNAISDIQNAKLAFTVSDLAQVKQKLLSAHKNIFLAWTKIPNNLSPKIITAIGQFENVFERSLESYDSKIGTDKLKHELERYQQKQVAEQGRLLTEKNKSKDITQQGQILQLISEKLKKAGEAIKLSSLDYSEILLESVEQLFKLM